MEPWVVATSLIFIYLLATIVLGVIANRRMTGDMEDFLLYGRKAGFIVLYLTVVATFHSAFAFLGSGGFFYTHGIGFWAAGTWTCLVGAITYVLGPRIWALGKANGYITPADMLADFYESEAVRVAVAIVSVVFTILYIQVQAQGLGYIINIASGDRISFEIGTLILLVVAAAYLMAGGLRAVYWTDVIQGVWMYVAVWVGAMYLAYELFGGPLQLWAEVRAQRPDLLSLPGPEGFFTPGMWLGMTITLSFGIVFQPHMMIRYYTAVDAKTLKILGAATPIYLMTLYVPAALVGLGGAVAMPGLEVPDRIFPGASLRARSTDPHGGDPRRSDGGGHVDARLDPACKHERTDSRRVPAVHRPGTGAGSLRLGRPGYRRCVARCRLLSLRSHLGLPCCAGDPQRVRSAAAHARDRRCSVPDTPHAYACGGAHRSGGGTCHVVRHPCRRAASIRTPRGHLGIAVQHGGHAVCVGRDGAPQRRNN